MWFRKSEGRAQLVARVEQLERQLASLKSDFLELEDKAYRWMQRAVQRSKREVSEASTQDRFDLVNQPVTRLDPVSERLIRRRSSLIPPLPTEKKNSDSDQEE
jgi:hypothetical protein